jgi:PPIC-type PPIASE domain
VFAGGTTTQVSVAPVLASTWCRRTTSSRARRHERGSGPRDRRSSRALPDARRIRAPDRAATAEQRSEARQRIEALSVRAKAGERFEQLARQYSDDATRQWGGELDPFSRGDMPKPFEDVAFALKPGEISAPVETAAGFHLIQLQERMPSVSVPLQSSRESIREHLRVARGREAIDRHVQALRALGKVEVLTPL